MHVAALGAGIDERPQGLERLGVVAAEHPELAREPLATLGEFGLAGLLPARVEARLEQFTQKPGQRRVAREGFFAVALRQRHAYRKAALAVSTTHRKLAPGQTVTKPEAVE